MSPHPIADGWAGSLFPEPITQAKPILLDDNSKVLALLRNERGELYCNCYGMIVKERKCHKCVGYVSESDTCRWVMSVHDAELVNGKPQWAETQPAPKPPWAGKPVDTFAGAAFRQPAPKLESSQDEGLDFSKEWYYCASGNAIRNHLPCDECIRSEPREEIHCIRFFKLHPCAYFNSAHCNGSTCEYWDPKTIACTYGPYLAWLAVPPAPAVEPAKKPAKAKKSRCPDISVDCPERGECALNKFWKWRPCALSTVEVPTKEPTAVLLDGKWYSEGKMLWDCSDCVCHVCANNGKSCYDCKGWEHCMKHQGRVGNCPDFRTGEGKEQDSEPTRAVFSVLEQTPVVVDGFTIASKHGGWIGNLEEIKLRVAASWYVDLSVVETERGWRSGLNTMIGDGGMGCSPSLYDTPYPTRYAALKDVAAQALQSLKREKHANATRLTKMLEVELVKQEALEPEPRVYTGAGGVEYEHMITPWKDSVGIAMTDRKNPLVCEPTVANCQKACLCARCRHNVPDGDCEGCHERCLSRTPWHFVLTSCEGFAEGSTSTRAQCNECDCQRCFHTYPFGVPCPEERSCKRCEAEQKADPKHGCQVPDDGDKADTDVDSDDVEEDTT